MTENINRVTMNMLPSHSVSAAMHTASQEEAVYSIQRIITFVCLPISIVGLIGNGMVLWILCNRSKRTKFIVYFFNMAAADFSILSYYVIVFVLFLRPAPVNLNVLLRMEMLHTFGFNASLYLLTAISTERYLTVFYPHWYQRTRPLHFTAFVCVVSWILSGVVSLVIHLACYLQFDPSHTEVIFSCEPARIFQLVVNFLVVGPILIFTTLALCTRNKRAPVKLNTTIVATVLLFLLLSASLRVVEVLAHWIPKLHMPKAFVFFQLSDTIHSSGKPFLYIYIGYSKQEVASEPIRTYLEAAFIEE